MSERFFWLFACIVFSCAILWTMCSRPDFSQFEKRITNLEEVIQKGGK